MRSTRKEYAVYALLIALCSLWRFLIHSPDIVTDEMLAALRFHVLSPDVLLTSAVWAGWGVSVRRRVLDTVARRLLWALSFCMLAYAFLQFTTYNFFSDDGYLFLRRYGRYLYQVPSNTMGLLLLLIACRVGLPGRSLRPVAVGGCAVLAIFFAFALTNDLHHLVFRPYPGMEITYGDYRYGPVMLAMVAVLPCSLLAAFVILLRRVLHTPAARFFPVPLLLLAAGMLLMLWQILSPDDRLISNLFTRTTLYNCTMLAFCEGCIRIGLIPSNSEHAAVFNASALSAQIVDQQGAVVLRSHHARFVTKEELLACGDGAVLLDPNTRLHRHPITGGYVVWTDDITELNGFHKRLAEAAERLEEEHSLARAEAELREEQRHIAQRKRIYDEIAIAVRPRLHALSALAAQARTDPDRRDAIMRAALVRLAYVKRRANLALRAGEDGSVPAAELCAGLAESLQYLGYCGAPGYLSGSPGERVPARAALAVYDLFEQAAEDALPGLSGVIVLASGGQDVCRLELQLGTPTASPVDSVWEHALAPWDVAVRMTKADGTLRVRLAIPAVSPAQEGGDTA